jgi:hypothetical protein
MLEYIINNYYLIFLAGLGGAFIADILKDNCIELPKKIGGKLFLGSFGGLIVGGLAGLAIDGSLTTAFMGGFMGKEIITRLIDGFPLTQNKKDIKMVMENLNIPCDDPGKTAP